MFHLRILIQSFETIFLFFGYKIQNNYDEIRNELEARGKDKASLNELTEILEKISGEKRLKMISE